MEMQTSGFTCGGYARQLAEIQFSGDRTLSLKRIAAPSLVRGAAQDRCLSPKRSHPAHALIPKSELRMFEGAGHDLDEAMLLYLENWLDATIPVVKPKICAQT